MCTLLGVNYQSEGANQDENQQMEKPKLMAASDRGDLVRYQANSEPTGVSNTRSNSGINRKYINNSSKRSGDTGNTLRSTTSVTDRQKQQSNPEPITNKPSVPTTPQKPTDNTTEPSKPTQPTTPNEPEPEPNQPDPVYLLSVETPIVNVEAIPTKEKEPLINIQIGDKRDGNKTNADSKQPNSNKAKNSDETNAHHHS